MGRGGARQVEAAWGKAKGKNGSRQGTRGDKQMGKAAIHSSIHQSWHIMYVYTCAAFPSIAFVASLDGGERPHPMAGSGRGNWLELEQALRGWAEEELLANSKTCFFVCQQLNNMFSSSPTTEQRCFRVVGELENIVVELLANSKTLLLSGWRTRKHCC